MPRPPRRLAVIAPVADFDMFSDVAKQPTKMEPFLSSCDRYSIFVGRFTTYEPLLTFTAVGAGAPSRAYGLPWLIWGQCPHAPFSVYGLSFLSPTGSLGLYGGAAPMPPTKKLNFHKSFSADALIFTLNCKKVVTKNEEKPPIVRRKSDACPTKKNLYLCRR